MIISIVIFILTLLILVLLHELGHLLVAKKFNIKVEEFGFGIPPRAWGKKFEETLISINWLPFGGFVRLLGEDELDKDVRSNPRSFAAQKVQRRIAVVVAGVLINLIFAWMLFYLTLASNSFKSQLPLLLDHHFFGAKEQTETITFIRDIVPNSPAALAGLKPGDTIISVNDKPIQKTEELIDLTKEMAGKEITLTVSGADRINSRQIKLIPRENPPEGEGPLGVSLAGVAVAHLEYQGLSKALAGPVHSLNIVVYSGKILGHLIGQSFKASSLEPVSQSFAGPVGISTTVNTILTETKKPLLAYLDFTALLSLNLAVFNVLPIPALDGGRLFFLTVEAITRKKVKAEVERWIHAVGMALLLTLMLLITFSDIKKLF